MGDDVTTGLGPGAGSPAPVTAPEAGGTPVAPSAEPTPYQLDENSMIQPKGYDKPVKWSEYSRGFQAQLTRASQKAAQAQRALAEREAQIRRYEQERAAQTRQQPGQQTNDVISTLRSLPYLDGETTARVVEGIATEFRQRDQLLLATLSELQRMQQVVNRLADTSNMSDFDARINRWLQDGGYPPEAADLAKEIYLAYEGDDLNEEFPRIFAERWSQVEKIMEARRAQRVASARRPAFVPGRGGAAGPSQPLQLDPNASPKELAEKLFPFVKEESGT